MAVDTGDGRLLITKGAPESVLEVAAGFEGGIAKEDCRAAYEALAARGFRVLGVAVKTLSDPPPYSARDEREMTFAGFLTFSDPLRPDTAEAIAGLRRDGVTAAAGICAASAGVSGVRRGGCGRTRLLGAP